MYAIFCLLVINEVRIFLSFPKFFSLQSAKSILEHRKIEHRTHRISNTEYRTLNIEHRTKNTEQMKLS